MQLTALTAAVEANCLWRLLGVLQVDLALRARHDDDDDDVYYYIRWRLKLEGETENMGVCTKERKGVTAAVLMATPCTNSLGGESGGQKHEGCGGRSACWKGFGLAPNLVG